MATMIVPIGFFVLCMGCAVWLAVDDHRREVRQRDREAMLQRIRECAGEDWP